MNTESWTQDRYRQALLWDARAGVELKVILPVAAEVLDNDKSIWTFIKCLVRQSYQKKAPPIEMLIYSFWDEFDCNDVPWNSLPGLCRWSAQAASSFVSFALRSRGFGCGLSPDAYRQRLTRLNRRLRIIKLEKKKPLLVTHAEFKKAPGTLIVDFVTF